MYQDIIRGELSEAATVLNAFLSDDKNIQQIEEAAKLLADSFKAGGKVLSCERNEKLEYLTKELENRTRQLQNELNEYVNQK